MRSSTGSLVIAINLEDTEKYLTDAMLLFYILQKELFQQDFNTSIENIAECKIWEPQ
jgi:hypothetical protein